MMQVNCRNKLDIPDIADRKKWSYFVELLEIHNKLFLQIFITEAETNHIIVF